MTAATGDPFLKQLALTDVLSFRTQVVELRKLNVLIGSNGSGKSNLIEAIDLLCSAGRRGGLRDTVARGGGFSEWKNKWAKADSHPTLEALVNPPNVKRTLRHKMTFRAVGKLYEFADERIENESAEGKQKPYFYFGYENGRPTINVRTVKERVSNGKSSQRVEDFRRELRRDTVDPQESILTQRQDAEQFPELWYLSKCYEQAGFYRDWQFGRLSAPRMPQRADLTSNHLLPDGTNLALVLNQLKKSEGWDKMLQHSRELYPDIDDIIIDLDGSAVQLVVKERGRAFPATRLSDGTLRYLCLLAILFDPNPPPLICIEEPELGLHPDVQVQLAGLLVQASERTQLVVTTHSEMLVSALSSSPESVVVCEKDDGGTKLTRLDGETLKHWLEKYRLGDLWLKGHIGGTRW